MYVFGVFELQFELVVLMGLLKYTVRREIMIATRKYFFFFFFVLKKKTNTDLTGLAVGLVVQ